MTATPVTALLSVAAAVLAASSVLLAWPRAAALPHGLSVPSGAGVAATRRAGRLRSPLLAGALAGVGTALFVGGPSGLVAGAVVGLAVGSWVSHMEPRAARRHREAVDDALPLAVDLLASCLAVGQAPGTALDEIARVLAPPLRDELAEISARLRLGADPVEVWRDVAAHPQLGGWGRAVLRAVDSGASVADAMAAHADDLRLTARSRTEARARAVGVRAALPLGVCLMPAFVLLGVVPLVAGSVSVVTLP
jgi:pilus assembly protein TadC